MIEHEGDAPSNRKVPVTIRTVQVGLTRLRVGMVREPRGHSDHLRPDEVWGWVTSQRPGVCEGCDMQDHLHGIAVNDGRPVRFLGFISDSQLRRFVKQVQAPLSTVAGAEGTA